MNRIELGSRGLQRLRRIAIAQAKKGNRAGLHRVEQKHKQSRSRLYEKKDHPEALQRERNLINTVPDRSLRHGKKGSFKKKYNPKTARHGKYHLPRSTNDSFAHQDPRRFIRGSMNEDGTFSIRPKKTAKKPMSEGEVKQAEDKTRATNKDLGVKEKFKPYGNTSPEEASRTSARLQKALDDMKGKSKGGKKKKTSDDDLLRQGLITQDEYDYRKKKNAPKSEPKAEPKPKEEPKAEPKRKGLGALVDKLKGSLNSINPKEAKRRASRLSKKSHGEFPTDRFYSKVGSGYTKAKQAETAEAGEKVSKETKSAANRLGKPILDEEGNRVGWVSPSVSAKLKDGTMTTEQVHNLVKSGEMSDSAAKRLIESIGNRTSAKDRALKAQADQALKVEINRDPEVAQHIKRRGNKKARRHLKHIAEQSAALRGEGKKTVLTKSENAHVLRKVRQNLPPEIQQKIGERNPRSVLTGPDRDTFEAELSKQQKAFLDDYNAKQKETGITVAQKKIAAAERNAKVTARADELLDQFGSSGMTKVTARIEAGKQIDAEIAAKGGGPKRIIKEVRKDPKEIKGTGSKQQKKMLKTVNKQAKLNAQVAAGKRKIDNMSQNQLEAWLADPNRPYNPLNKILEPYAAKHLDNSRSIYNATSPRSRTTGKSKNRRTEELNARLDQILFGEEEDEKSRRRLVTGTAAGAAAGTLSARNFVQDVKARHKYNEERATKGVEGNPDKNRQGVSRGIEEYEGLEDYVNRKGEKAKKAAKKEGKKRKEVEAAEMRARREARKKFPDKKSTRHTGAWARGEQPIFSGHAPKGFRPTVAKVAGKRFATLTAAGLLAGGTYDAIKRRREEKKSH